MLAQPCLLAGSAVHAQNAASAGNSARDAQERQQTQKAGAATGGLSAAQAGGQGKAATRHRCIDVHHHCAPPSWLSARARSGPLVPTSVSWTWTTRRSSGTSSGKNSNLSAAFTYGGT